MLPNKNKQLQEAIYQPGIGTQASQGFMTQTFKKGSQLLDEAFAWDLKKHLLSGYEYMVNAYQPGDRVCLFGFSRGAYTARALAGMLFKVGLLPSSATDAQVQEAYNLYASDDASKEEWQKAKAFKGQYCRNVPVDFMGVWDTVSSVGGITSVELPFSRSNSGIRIFRHAMGLDEHRAKFKVAFWGEETPEDREIMGEDPAAPPHPSDVEEVWFSGAHCGMYPRRPPPSRLPIIDLIYDRCRRRFSLDWNAGCTRPDNSALDDS
jgi:uncharacterized protein (DUF2235 family)